MEPKIQPVDGSEVVRKIKENMENMLRKKVAAVEVSRSWRWLLKINVSTYTFDDNVQSAKYEQ